MLAPAQRLPTSGLCKLRDWQRFKEAKAKASFSNRLQPLQRVRSQGTLWRRSEPAVGDLLKGGLAKGEKGQAGINHASRGMMDTWWRPQNGLKRKQSDFQDELRQGFLKHDTCDLQLSHLPPASGSPSPLGVFGNLGVRINILHHIANGYLYS